MYIACYTALVKQLLIDLCCCRAPPHQLLYPQCAASTTCLQRPLTTCLSAWTTSLPFTLQAHLNHTPQLSIVTATFSVIELALNCILFHLPSWVAKMKVAQIFRGPSIFGGLTCLPLKRSTGCHVSQSFWKTCGVSPGHNCFPLGSATVVTDKFSRSPPSYRLPWCHPCRHHDQKQQDAAATYAVVVQQVSWHC